MPKIKVLVVDDSFFMRKLLSDVLNSDPKIKVCGTAKNGEIALKKIHQLKPNVVTLDYQMPQWTGLATLKKIMKKCPVACLMVSAYTKEGAKITLDCLTAGAIDYVLKPSGQISWDIEKVKNDIIAKVKAASLVDIEQFLKILARRIRKPKPLTKIVVPIPGKVVIIGASTGGPAVISQILQRLPKNLPAAVVIVQHMSASFIGLFADRLNTECPMHVKKAKDGEEVKTGTVYIAPGDHHLEVEKKEKNGQVKAFIDINKNPAVGGYRPAITTTMKSVAMSFGKNALGIILTGMGNDGASGLKEICEKGGHTVVQDRTTSLINSMPENALKKGCVDEILPAGRIAGRIVRLVRC